MGTAFKETLIQCIKTDETFVGHFTAVLFHCFCVLALMMCDVRPRILSLLPQLLSTRPQTNAAGHELPVTAVTSIVFPPPPAAAAVLCNNHWIVIMDSGLPLWHWPWWCPRNPLQWRRSGRHHTGFTLRLLIHAASVILRGDVGSPECYSGVAINVHR